MFVSLEISRKIMDHISESRVDKIGLESFADLSNSKYPREINVPKVIFCQKSQVHTLPEAQGICVENIQH